MYLWRRRAQLSFHIHLAIIHTLETDSSALFIIAAPTPNTAQPARAWVFFFVFFLWRITQDGNLKQAQLWYLQSLSSTGWRGFLSRNYIVFVLNFRFFFLIQRQVKRFANSEWFHYWVNCPFKKMQSLFLQRSPREDPISGSNYFTL